MLQTQLRYIQTVLTFGIFITIFLNNENLIISCFVGLILAWQLELLACELRTTSNEFILILLLLITSFSPVMTIFFEEGHEDLPQFLAKNKVIVTASLPCYEKNNVDFQRGFGVFEKSINAIKILNDLGYGKKENGLQLNLVYNPVSPNPPPSQEKLEKDYKKILFEKYNIVFNNLYTITNMPINRYEESLRREGKLNTYYKLLKENFNEKNIENLMCKKTISVNWLGEIYDCDFNQQINFRDNKGPKTLFDLLDESFTFDYRVAVKEHCFACTAGAGSSCGGTLS